MEATPSASRSSSNTASTGSSLPASAISATRRPSASLRLGHQAIITFSQPMRSTME